MKEDDVIEHGMLSKAIESAQKKVEGNNFGIRKHLLQYDQVMNEQREIIYGERDKIIDGEDLQENIKRMLKAVLDRAVDAHTAESDDSDDWKIAELNKQLMIIFHKPAVEITNDERDTITKDIIKERLYDEALDIYAQLEEKVGQEEMRNWERAFLMNSVDTRWMTHIDEMDQMRQGISLRSYAQRDPLVEYKFLGFEMFEEMSNNIQQDTVWKIFNVHLQTGDKQPRMRQIVKKEDQFTQSDDTAVKKPAKRSEAKIGPNAPCPCKSGKKYKHCCKNKIVG